MVQYCLFFINNSGWSLYFPPFYSNYLQQTWITPDADLLTTEHDLYVCLLKKTVYFLHCKNWIQIKVWEKSPMMRTTPCERNIRMLLHTSYEKSMKWISKCRLLRLLISNSLTFHRPNP